MKGYMYEILIIRVHDTHNSQVCFVQLQTVSDKIVSTAVLEFKKDMDNYPMVSMQVISRYLAAYNKTVQILVEFAKYCSFGA